MSKSQSLPTIVITDTDRLSAMADSILAGAGNPKLTKNTILNLIAGSLAGPKTNWGGLKAMPSPVKATKAVDDSASDEDLILFDHKVEEQKYQIEGTSLVFLFGNQTNPSALKSGITLTEIPAIEHALFSENGSGKYSTTNLSLQKIGQNQIVITTSLLWNWECEAIFIDKRLFQRFLKRHRDNILKILAKDFGTGTALNDAFLLTIRGSGEEFLYEIAAGFPELEEKIHYESKESNVKRLRKACLEAVWLFLAQAAEDDKRRTAIRRADRFELTDIVENNEGHLVTEALRSALKAEVEAAK